VLEMKLRTKCLRECCAPRARRQHADCECTSASGGKQRSAPTKNDRITGLTWGKWTWRSTVIVAMMIISWGGLCDWTVLSVDRKTPFGRPADVAMADHVQREADALEDHSPLPPVIDNLSDEDDDDESRHRQTVGFCHGGLMRAREPLGGIRESRSGGNSCGGSRCLILRC
jgi:hypothetical protein